MIAFKNFILLLKRFACYKQKSFFSAKQKFGTCFEFIAGKYVCVLQPLDVDVMLFLRLS